ncbi:hypothetical protein [Intrasporangium flavum]|uniref:hypothetical protein n=1 Tax=Intrasporangium flavum TaxID=1428657 RepID=UPI00096E5536|nr:hypothetical protein [Intrasporangium flavum]
MSDADSSTAASFPDRPIRVVRTGTTPPTAQLVLAAFFVALAVGCAGWLVSTIAPDLAIRANPVTISDGQVDGSCHVKRALADCSVTLTYTVDGRTHVVPRDYFWVDIGGHDYSTDIIVAGDDPSNATASVALEKLPNRVLTAVGSLLLFLGCAVVPVRHYRRSRRARESYDTEQVLRFVAVPVVSVQDVFLRGKAYRYTAPDGSGPKLSSLITEAEVAPYGLADGRLLAAMAEGQDPILLDQGLTRLDLTDEERARIATAASTLVTRPVRH